MDDALERVIRPIVEGQIRGFLKEHPVIAEAVDWYKPRKDDKATTFTNSLAKRIIRDLLCSTTRARLAAAIVESGLALPCLSTVERHCGEHGPLGCTTERASAPFSLATPSQSDIHVR